MIRFCLSVILFVIFSHTMHCNIIIFQSIQDDELVNNRIFSNYTLSSTLLDIYILIFLSITTSFIALYKSYHDQTLHLQAHTTFVHIPRRHPHNNTLKTREEIEEEALEEQCCPNKFTRFIYRYTFITELVVLVMGLLIIMKCLARLNVEIGVLDEGEDHHPLFWITLCISAFHCSFTSFGLEAVCIRVSAIGNERRQRLATEDRMNPRRRMRGGRDIFSMSEGSDGYDASDLDRSGVGSHLEEPLLSSALDAPSSVHHIHDEEEIDDDDDDDDDRNENGDNNGGSTIATSNTGITTDSHYKAGWKDLMALCYPDWHYFTFAFVFLILAAVAQVLIPRYTGNMLDAIATYAPNIDDKVNNIYFGYSYGDNDDGGGDHNHGYIWNVPGFLSNMKKLVAASILGGVFSGLRGAIFTAVGVRVNVRLRTMLMDSLLAQDIGFFDITKTGDITSRLSSDTTLVGDQVTLNVNVFLRSLVQAIGVLIYMAILSWQLTLLAFISVPAITIMSRWYGNYIRSLTKLMQKKLADGNSISEAALGSMPTVRAFGAESTEMNEFNVFMDQYKRLNKRYAFAYLGYGTAITSLPQLVTAVVLFYGGLLVMADGNDHITSGELVSFLLYLSSLSDAFNSIGYIFASLTQAVGAADKVFELIHRKPVRKRPTTSDDETVGGVLVADTKNTFNNIQQFRSAGVRPVGCAGEVTLNKVTLSYPARPERKILNEMTLFVPAGAVAALVGPSGGGKSSIVSLIQNLYEPQNGDIFIDGVKISDLSPDWLSKNVAVVSQEPTLFARSIKRNIMYGLEGTESEPTMREIKEAAKKANAHEFIENLPMKYETDVGERGVQLSGKEIRYDGYAHFFHFS